MLLRVVFRALVLTVAVLGLSLAFAWVWDRAEPRTSPPLGAPSAHPPSPR
jgi:cell division septal protein FtsQ